MKKLILEVNKFKGMAHKLGNNRLRKKGKAYSVSKVISSSSVPNSAS